ncbi:DUF3472 domain-containing protein [Ochrobactrum soli]|uniref:Uncharacterized protein n=1 Tax=Ochrobactrum soli TaxID=2448455 RepID=A0A849KUE5_9HYPH|nr:hypothetical protein [[Ochrobactrum] soli]NNU58772.1 hypothetical protein [[Ochrobactrum] soli]
MRKSKNFINADDQSLVPSWGPYITSKFKSDSAELYYIEQGVPRDGLANGIEWSGCDFHFNEPNGYVGIRRGIGNSNICLFWNADDPSISGAGNPVLLDYVAPTSSVIYSQGNPKELRVENQFISPMPWNVDTWYATVIRRWKRPNRTDNFMGYFMYDYSSGIWTEYMVANLGLLSYSLEGDSITGYLQRFGGSALGYSGIYGQHFKMQAGGVWEKPLYYTASGGEPYSSWTAELAQNVNIKLTAGGNFGNNTGEIKLTPNQFDAKPKPAGPSEILDFSASYDNDKRYITFNWNLNNKKPPQLNFTITVYENFALDGYNILSFSDAIPSKRQWGYELDPLNIADKYIAKIDIVSIFDEKSSSFAEFNIN